jgi:hypothetical protein
LCKEYPALIEPCKATTYRVSKKFLAIVSRLDKYEIRKFELFLDEASFTLSCSVKSQNSKF